MKGKKYAMMGALIFATMLMMAMPSLAITAADLSLSGTDVSGDVTDPHVDLISASSTVEGSDVVLSLTVSGTIVENNVSYTYGFTLMDSGDNGMVIVSFSEGNASYSTTGEMSTASYTINGGTLEITIPFAVFSSFSGVGLMTATAIGPDAEDTIMIYGSSSGGGGSGGSGGGSGGYHGEKCPDPTTETPTDTSISVEITEVKITYEKVDNGTMIHMAMLIKGTTSGVDHVSLNTVWYYTNGSHDWGASWMKGPINPPPYAPPGMTIKEMYFKSTSGNWNTWELNMDITGPTMYMEGNYSGSTHIVDISKVRIYARAFADPEETQWNQAYYEFTPQVSGNGDSMTYDSTQESSSGGGGEGIPGFEVAAMLGAISIATIAYAYIKRK